MPRRRNPTPVEAVRHQDKRVNIPTEELRDFVAEDEERPATMLYPRDPSLDPQLVWQGKDEQDREPLAVPVVPVYIQEKIRPQALIEDFRAQARRANPPDQMDLFGDFNGLDFERQLDFYHHQQNWSNRMILGDSLLVMTSLAEKEGLKGQVQMIYLDPPYGIKFGSNWQVSTRKRDVKDGKAEDVTRQPEQVRAFRDTWTLGIHSYLAYLRDRLVVARDLLTDTGSIFVQIGDENVHLVRCVMDEVFGSENCVSQILFRKSGGLKAAGLARIGDHLLWYGRDAGRTRFRRLLLSKVPGLPGASQYRYARGPAGDLRELSPAELLAADLHDILAHDNTTSQGNPVYEYVFRGRTYRGGFKPPPAGMQRLALAGRLEPMGDTLRYLRPLADLRVFDVTQLWDDTAISGFAEGKVYVVQTTPDVVARCLLMTTDPGDLVLDPTCGSGTTAYVAEQWGRRWITIDTSRVALALARTRLMTAKYPYYLLADTDEGIAKESEALGYPAPDPSPNTVGDIRHGFVYKRVPHITLKSIANNEEIDEIHSRWQERLEPLRTELNALVGQSWEEWEVPREPVKGWSAKAGKLLSEWWEGRRERQREIDESIARQADTELLYDQPYEDAHRLRVSGPFTVESLSPHRVLSTDEELPSAEREGRSAPGPGQFETMILGNLKAAGVQNTIKNERLRFDRLEPYAGVYLHGAGEYAEADGTTRRVAVCIGPEHGTVGPQHVKEAAKEAVQGVGFDTLIVCGFAFDPHVSEEAKRYGKLTVLPARMNPDLSMGDELLKKTGAGNLFMVFGEPDLEVAPQPDGKLVVQVRGVDVYDPTTGQVRSHATDDIACWFVDTNYNGESFFVRHAYFTGADEPYEKLQRALRAEVDEAAWAALYSTTSRPFDPPATGRIAVKVINHYGDEVLKVYEVTGPGGTA